MLNVTTAELVVFAGSIGGVLALTNWLKKEFKLTGWKTLMAAVASGICLNVLAHYYLGTLVLDKAVIEGVFKALCAAGIFVGITSPGVERVKVETALWEESEANRIGAITSGIPIKAEGTDS